MFLKRLDLQGFKTFANRTEIEFSGGMTAVVGPNGAGKCLTGDALVTLADGRDVPIRELVDDALDGDSAIETLDDGQIARPAVASVGVLSLDPTTLRLCPRPVSAFVKRSAPPFLLRVRTRSGREVTATPYHPLFTLEDGRLRALRADELAVGTRLALPRRLPVEPSPAVLDAANLLGAFDESDRVYVPSSEPLRAWARLAKGTFSGIDAWSRQTAVAATQLRGLLDGQGVNAAVLTRVAAASTEPPPIAPLIKSKGTGHLRVPDVLSPELARFLGLLIAEGRNTSATQVWFVNADPAVSAEFARLADVLFGVTAVTRQYKPGSTDTLLFSRPLCKLLERVFGFDIDSRSADKQAPPQVLAAEPAVRWAFLSGLLEGDGHIHLRGTARRPSQRYVEYVTASRTLAGQVAALLLRCGVFAVVRSRRKRATNSRAPQFRLYHSVFVYGTEQLRRLAENLSFVGQKQAALDGLRRLAPTDNPNLDLVPGATAIVREAVHLAGVSVKRHRAGRAKLAAYSEARCEASRGGLLEVTAQIEALGDGERARERLALLRTLATSDVYWDEITAIERVAPTDPWVYDLCVDETHNFVANNVVVHNSNVADAIRWVLGEQSMRTLRCKKTEDVIFAGGAGKPPAGMAEVSITFDNATGWLDTPHQEVVVTRRAYRSGENEYYLNRARARLRDVTDLLLKANVSPNGYTVIGQGMVDLALSLKPEERRELFEDAAGIRHHHVRLHDARNRLAATEANLSRVRDVIAEVEPRLKQLERRARQLRERDGVRAELRSYLAGWYGHRWLELRAEADAAAAREAEATEALAEARAAAEAALEEVAELTARQEHLRGRLAEIERARVELSGRAERLWRELALRKERAEASRARAIELRDEYDLLEERGRADEMAAAAARDHIARLESDVSDLTEALAEAEGANEGRRERANLLRQQLLHAQAATERLRQERAALESELGRTAARRRELAAEAERQGEAARRDEARILAGQAEIDRARAGQAELQGALSANAAEAARLRDEIAGARDTQEAIGVKLADTARQRAAVQGRLEVLNDSRDGYAGYYAGVRSVMASRGGKLDGVVGLVAALVRVPTELEVAMEVALGSHLQDVVVERWEHAEAAVEMLKRTSGGRATFLPLDTVRGGPPPSSPTGPGVRGRAADLVQFDEAHRPVVEHLLGRTLVVTDLATARRHLLPGWQIVTLGGEIVRAGGAITGGSEGRSDRTLLARERERRELPERLARIVAKGKSLEDALRDARGRQDELEAAQRGLADDRRKVELDEAAAGREAAAAAGRVERLRREVEWSREMAQRASAELAELGGREAAARARLVAFPRGAKQHEELIGALESRLAALTAATHEQSERLSTVRNSVAVIEGERRAQTRLLEGHQERRQQVEGEMEARKRRIDELIGVASGLAGEIESLDAARGAVEDQRASVEMETRPVQLELAALVEQTRLLQAGEPAVRAQLNQLTDALRAESLAALSARDHLEALLREASLALGELEPEQSRAEADAEGAADEAGQPDLTYEPLASPDATWRRIELLRSRLRGIGAVDASAGQEYDEASARHAFLTGQAADLVDARKLLEEAIGELEATMQARFSATFEAVAVAFRKQFTALFGGGTARLVLAEEDGGIEIVAQPPGKRAQSLSLLSGGERALTAVAILFAIFEVNPSPVCVLDEVDAALDDANIVRFAETLRRLAERTQFVVITHNRGTMEAADSLYGITMHDRSVSRTVSLKLSDIPEKERVPA